MKLFDMIYAVVIAFKPHKRPWFALAALALFLVPVTAATVTITVRLLLR